MDGWTTSFLLEAMLVSGRVCILGAPFPLFASEIHEGHFIARCDDFREIVPL